MVSIKFGTNFKDILKKYLSAGTYKSIIKLRITLLLYLITFILNFLTLNDALKAHKKTQSIVLINCKKHWTFLNIQRTIALALRMPSLIKCIFSKRVILLLFSSFSAVLSLGSTRHFTRKRQRKIHLEAFFRRSIE